MCFPHSTSCYRIRLHLPVVETMLHLLTNIIYYIFVCFSYNECVKTPKLVIRHRSGDLPGASTAELFVDTMDSSPPPPLSVPFPTKFSSSHSLGSPSRRSPVNPCASSKNGESQQLYQTETKLQTASHSTVSPASMGA